MPLPGASPNLFPGLPQAPRAGSSCGELGEPQVFPAKAAHSWREERSWCWGCPSFLSPLPLVPALPLQGARQIFSLTHSRVVAIYLARGCPSFICLAETWSWVGSSWTGRAGPAARWVRGGWPPSFPGDTQPGGDRNESLPFSSPTPSTMKHHNQGFHLPSAPRMGGAGLGLASDGNGGGKGSPWGAAGMHLPSHS